MSSKATHDAASISLFPFRSRMLRRSFYPFWALWNIYRLKKQFEIVFLYSTYEPPIIITSYMAKKIFKLKWVADIFDDPEKELLILKSFFRTKDCLLLFFKEVEFLITKNLLKCADKVVTVIPNEVQKKYLVSPSIMLSVTNGINLDYNFNRQVKKRDNVFTLFYCGTIEQIRLEGFFPCLLEVVKEISPVRIILIGRELNNGYKWICHELKSLKEKVILDFRGVQPYDSVVKAIAESDVCLCPYPNKLDLAPAYPVKIFDYMAVGRPIVASSLPGTNKIIKHRFNGLLFKPGDYFEMAQQIINVHNSLELRDRLSQNTRESVLEFDYNRIHKKILYFLEN